MDKAKTMIQMVCSIVALPANSATDRLEIAINFFVNLNKASKAWLLAVPANLMPIAKAAVKKVYLKDSICCCQLQKKVNTKKRKPFFPFYFEKLFFFVKLKFHTLLTSSNNVTISLINGFIVNSVRCSIF